MAQSSKPLACPNQTFPRLTPGSTALTSLHQGPIAAPLSGLALPQKEMTFCLFSRGGTPCPSPNSFIPDSTTEVFTIIFAKPTAPRRKRPIYIESTP